MSRWAFVRALAPEPGSASSEALAEALMALSSTVALGPEGVWLEVSRSVTLFGSELALARQAREIAEQLDLCALVAVADHPETARVLALCSPRPLTLAAPGGDLEALAPLSVEALGASPKALAYLARLGVRTVGALSQLSPSALRRRLDTEGERLVHLARAQPLKGSGLRRYIPPEQPAATRELEPPLPPGEAVLFVIKAALDELTTRLSGRGLAVAALRLTLRLEGDLRREEELLLPRPLRATSPLLALLRERLLGQPQEGADDGTPAAPNDWPERIIAVEVRALRTAPMPQAQLSLQSRKETDAEQLSALLARLTATLGAQSVFAAELVETHRPEAGWRQADFSPEPKPRAARARGPQKKKVHGLDLEEPPSPRPLLVLPEPLPLEGELVAGERLRWEADQGVVKSIWGPERLRGQWWVSPFDRDYYVIDLSDGARIWAYWDRRAEALFLQGIFD